MGAAWWSFMFAYDFHVVVICTKNVVRLNVLSGYLVWNKLTML